MMGSTSHSPLHVEGRASTYLIGNGVATLAAEWTNELDTVRIQTALNRETQEEAQEPEVQLNKKTVHMSVSC